MKRMFVLPLFIIFTQNAFALDCKKIDGSCPAGCGWNTYTSDCQECPLDTYSPGGESQCADCYIPNDASLTGENPGMVDEYSCPWTLTCGENAYFDKESGQCTSCGDNYTSIYHDKGGFTMEFRGTGQEEFNILAERYSHDNVCEPNVKRIQLSPGTQFNTDDNNLWPGTTEVYYTKGVYYKYDTGFRTDNSAIGSWVTKLPDNALQPTNDLKTFLGYAENASMCSTGKLVFDSNGNLMESNNYDLRNVPSSLVACWENKAIGINYFMNKKSGDDVVEVALKRQCMVNDNNGQLEYYEDGKLTGNECVAMEYDTSKYYVEPGKVFSHYELRCQSPGTGFEPCGDVTVPNKIPVPVSTVILSPVFSDCPAGYYCNAGDQQPCPPGTTSDAGATSIDDCEMRGGPNGVKFCDSIGCFTLPAGTVIKPYQP